MVCDACRVSDVAGLAPETLSWASALLGMRFSDIASIQVDQSCVFDALRLMPNLGAGARLHSLEVAQFPIHLRIVLGACPP